MLSDFTRMGAGVLSVVWLTAPVFPQSEFWPVELNVSAGSSAPVVDGTDSAAASLEDSLMYDSSDAVGSNGMVASSSDGDSTDVLFQSDISLFQTFKARSRLDWRQRLSRGTLDQSVEYRYQQDNPQTRMQSLDLPGSFIRHNCFTPGLDAGVSWTPIVSYNKRQFGTMQSSADVGPVISHSLFSIPYTIRGGLYGYASGDSINSLRTTSMDRFHSDPGVYAGCLLGNGGSALGRLPLYLSVNAQGRSIKGNNLGLFYGSLLYADRVPLLRGDDSLFVHFGDSITNGKELFMGDFDGASLLSNTSWRINHSFSGTAGIKIREIQGFRAQLYYRYLLHSITYPMKIWSLDDIRTTRNMFGLALQSKGGKRLTYKGGIEFTGEFEDWLYGIKFNGTPRVNSVNRDSLIINQSDHTSDIARSGHEFLLDLPGGFSTKYSFNAFKDSKKYTFEFFIERDSLQKNQNENDRIQLDHRLSVRFDRDSLFSAELYGGYEHLYHYYYRKQRSAESRQTREYRIGLDCRYSTEIFDFREQLYSDAEVTDYHFRRVGKPPPYSRDLTSTFSGKWKLRKDRLSLIGKWVEMYHDDGSWYGEGYLPDTGVARRDYYAIEKKSTQYWVDISLENLFGSIMIVPGCLLRDVFQRSYDREMKKYVVSSLDLGYDIEPYVRLDVQTERLFLRSRLQRIINTQDPRWKDMEKNWLISVSLQMVF